MPQIEDGYDEERAHLGRLLIWDPTETAVLREAERLAHVGRKLIAAELAAVPEVARNSAKKSAMAADTVLQQLEMLMAAARSAMRVR